jgi:hypothetical protein
MRRARLEDVVPVDADWRSSPSRRTTPMARSRRCAARSGRFGARRSSVPAERRRQRGALAAAFGADAIVSCALTVPVERTRDGRRVAANRAGSRSRRSAAVAHNWLVATFARTAIPGQGRRRLSRDEVVEARAQHRRERVVRDPQRVARTPGAAWTAMFELELRADSRSAAVMKALGLAADRSSPVPDSRAARRQRRLPSADRARGSWRTASPARAAASRPRCCSICAPERAAPKAKRAQRRGRRARARAGIATPVNAVYRAALDDIAHMPRAVGSTASGRARCWRRSRGRSGGARSSAAMRHPDVPKRSTAGTSCIACSGSIAGASTNCPRNGAPTIAREAGAYFARSLAASADGDVSLAQLLGHKAT